jgi:hypothetical protein
VTEERAIELLDIRHAMPIGAQRDQHWFRCPARLPPFSLDGPCNNVARVVAKGYCGPTAPARWCGRILLSRESDLQPLAIEAL